MHLRSSHWLTTSVNSVVAPAEVGLISSPRFAGAALLPVALIVPALVALSLLATVWVALHAYERIWWREARAETRAQRMPA